MSMEPVAVILLPVRPPQKDMTDAALRELAESALAQARDDAEKVYQLRANVEIAGAFGGLGESGLVLTLWHLAKLGAEEFGKGAAGAAGGAFVKEYLVPRLRQLDVLPGEPKDITTPDEDGKAK